MLPENLSQVLLVFPLSKQDRLSSSLCPSFLSLFLVVALSDSSKFCLGLLVASLELDYSSFATKAQEQEVLHVFIPLASVLPD